MIELTTQKGDTVRLAPRNTDNTVSLIDVAKIAYYLGPVSWWHPLEPVSPSDCTYIRMVCNHTREAVANVCGAFEPLPWQWSVIVDESIRLGVFYRMRKD